MNGKKILEGAMQALAFARGETQDYEREVVRSSDGVEFERWRPKREKPAIN